MSNQIRLKRGSGSDPSASDLVVGEVALRTDNGKLFTKKDDNSIAEIGTGLSDGDKGDITISNSGATFTIDSGVVSTGKIANSAITNAKLNDSAITTAKIANNAVTTAKILDGNVTSAKILDGTITNADINASAAIARTKLANVDVVDDTSPQLGGNLDTNGNIIIFPDSNGTTNRLIFGTNKFEMYYDSGNSRMQIDNITGDFSIRNQASGGDIDIIAGDDIRIRPQGGENGINLVGDGATELYFNSSKKFETTSTGATVTGDLNATNDVIITGSGEFYGFDNSKIVLGHGRDLKIYHDGSHSYIQDVGTGDLKITSNGGQVVFQKGTTETLAAFETDSGCELYFDNSKKLETAADRVNVFGSLVIADGSAIEMQNGFTNAKVQMRNAGGSTDGNFEFLTRDGGGSLVEALEITKDAHIRILNDNKRLKIGASDDLQIYHDGSHSRISEVGTGKLILETNGAEIQLNKGTTENMIKCFTDGAVELYHNNVKQIQTTANGVGFVNNCTFSDNKKIQMGDANDLQIYHDGSFNFIRSENGHPVNIIKSTTENIAKFFPDGAVELYFDNSKKFETISSGGLITGRLGIGESSPSNLLHLKGSGHDKVLVESTGTNHAVGIQMTHASGNAAEQVWQLQTSGGASTQRDLSIRDATSGVLNTTFRKGGGITFNGDTAAANALDDYEQGTFSATASAVGYSGGSAIAMADESYTKIGNMVYFNMRLQVASSLSDGDLTITGLPFTASQDSVVNFSWQDSASFNGGQGKISGTRCVRFNGIFPTHHTGTANIIFEGTYRTNS